MDDRTEPPFPPAPPLDLGGTESEFELVFVEQQRFKWTHPWVWRLRIPQRIITNEHGREFAVALRDALRDQGFNVRLTAKTTLIDEVP